MLKRVSTCSKGAKMASLKVLRLETEQLKICGLFKQLRLSWLWRARFKAQIMRYSFLAFRDQTWNLVGNQLQHCQCESDNRESFEFKQQAVGWTGRDAWLCILHTNHTQ